MGSRCESCGASFDPDSRSVGAMLCKRCLGELGISSAVAREAGLGKEPRERAHSPARESHSVPSTEQRDPDERTGRAMERRSDSPDPAP